MTRILDREAALTLAIKQAMELQRIRMIYAYSQGWFVDSYQPSNRLIPSGDANTIRYILPGGEVTKLS